MGKILFIIAIISVSAVNILNLSAQSVSATDIVRKADEKFNGEKSSIMVMSMTIIRPT
ncbi:MAG: hypothetical protein IMZ64_01955, partial [Bacteroidetes bacterium]|nr:hypothetical protein [Bacteroidota bacterium]